MKHHDQVADAFGTTAAAYLTSAVHATGADLQDWRAKSPRRRAPSSSTWAAARVT